MNKIFNFFLWCYYYNMNSKETKYYKFNFKTNYFNNKDLKIEKSLITELYRLDYYDNLKKELLDKLEKINCKYSKLIIEIMNIIIFNHDNRKDPIFDIISPFNKENLNEFFNVKKCMYCPPEVISDCINIFPTLSKSYISFYNKINEPIKDYQYIISYKLENIKTVILSIKIEKFPLLYDTEFSISLFLFNNLFNMYMSTHQQGTYKKYNI